MGIRANDIIGVRLYMGKIKFNFKGSYKNKKKNPPLLPIKTIRINEFGYMIQSYEFQIHKRNALFF